MTDQRLLGAERIERCYCCMGLGKPEFRLVISFRVAERYGVQVKDFFCHQHCTVTEPAAPAPTVQPIKRPIAIASQEAELRERILSAIALLNSEERIYRVTDVEKLAKVHYKLLQPYPGLSKLISDAALRSRTVTYLQLVRAAIERLEGKRRLSVARIMGEAGLSKQVFYSHPAIQRPVELAVLRSGGSLPPAMRRGRVA